MKHLITKKKFYNKWLYKCSFYFPTSKLLRIQIESLNPLDSETSKFFQLLSSINKDQYYIRVENKICDVYCNDSDIFDKLKSFEGDNLVSVSSPDLCNIKKLQKQTRNILCNRLPFHRYRYKAYLQPHKIKDQEEKQKYIDWLSLQHPKIHLTESTKKWFIRTQWNWDRRYMYVEDEKTLLLLKMKHSGAIGSVYTYDVCDK